jgi:hypothetical protein
MKRRVEKRLRRRLAKHFRRAYLRWLGDHRRCSTEASNRLAAIDNFGEGERWIRAL